MDKKEEVYQILELGKHLKNLHHKKGFGGLLFIDLSMIKFSKLSSYIRKLDKENQELKEQKQEWINLLDMFKNQQKEFIEYLENMLDNENDIFSVVRVKDVLSKYEEIIGGK